MHTPSTNSKLLAVTIHVLGWTLLFSFPIIMRMNVPVDIDFPREIKLKNNIYFLFLIVLFYVNYLVLIPKLLLRKRFIYYTLSALAALMLVVFANNALDRVLGVDQAAIWMRSGIREARVFDPDSARSYPLIERTDSLKTARYPRLVIRRSPFDFPTVLSASFILLLGTGIRFGRQWFESERQKEEIEREKLQTELSFLKSQINPHFFFNMLNNIYSLIPSNPPQAQKAVHKLSKLMRYVLYESAKDRVTLEMEIAFINNYLDLAKIRLTGNTEIYFDHSEEDAELPIPPLLFVPFLENIFKHGIHQNEPSGIVISLKQAGMWIHFHSRNRIFSNSYLDDAEGIGLKNIRRRLDLLYNDSYSLSIREEGEQFEVDLKIPVHDH